MSVSLPLRVNGVAQLSPFYGGMNAYDATALQTINTTAVYHAVIGLSTNSDISGTTFTASTTGAITDTENNGGVLRCTDVEHGLTSGQYVTLNGMGDAAHNGLTVVDVITGDIFDCTNITYNSIDDTGAWQRGSCLTVDSGSDGLYAITWSVSGLSATAANKNFKWEVVKNITDLDEFASERKYAIQDDLGSVSAGGLIHLVATDCIWMQVKNTTDDGNFSIKHASISMQLVGE